MTILYYSFTLTNVIYIEDRNMRKLEDEYNWEGVAEDLAKTAKIWLNRKRIGDPKFQPNERLIRDYVAKERKRGILWLRAAYSISCMQRYD